MPVRATSSSTHSLHLSSLFRWSLESPRRTPRSISLQEPEHRFRQPNLSSKHRRAVRHRPGPISVSADQTDLRISSGSVCLDVINQTWSPMFDMINIFEVFLPQLLRYPNPTDPLNGEAAAVLMRDPKVYEAKVKGEQVGRMPRESSIVWTAATLGDADVLDDQPQE